MELFKILNVCADRVDENEVYLTPLLEMLKIVGKPFFKEKMSDESTYEQIAIESISQLGKLLYIYYCVIIFKIKTESVSEGPYL